MSITPKIWS